MNDEMVVNELDAGDELATKLLDLANCYQSLILIDEIKKVTAVKYLHEHVYFVRLCFGHVSPDKVLVLQNIRMLQVMRDVVLLHVCTDRLHKYL